MRALFCPIMKNYFYYIENKITRDSGNGYYTNFYGRFIQISNFDKSDRFYVWELTRDKMLTYEILK